MHLIFKQNHGVKNSVRKKYYFKSCWYVMILYFPKFCPLWLPVQTGWHRFASSCSISFPHSLTKHNYKCWK